MAKHIEIAIIGAGTAGMRAYREAATVTNSVLLIEGGEFGTTCARVGCMPSKLLIAAADAAHCGAHAEPFGVRYMPPEIDGSAVMKRVRDERDRFVSFVIEAVHSLPEKNRAMARARFKSDHELELSNGETIVADRFVIATGSRTSIPPIFKDFGDRLITNDDVFSWQDLRGRLSCSAQGSLASNWDRRCTGLACVSLFLGRIISLDRLLTPRY